LNKEICFLLFCSSVQGKSDDRAWMIVGVEVVVTGKKNGSLERG